MRLLAEPGTKGKSSYKLSEVYESYFSTNDGSVKLPENWLASKEGSIFKNEDGIVTETAQIVAVEMSEDDYNSLVESYGSYYTLEDVDNLKYTAKKIHDDSTGYAYDMYLIYNDGLVVQALFIDASDSEINTVLNSLDLPSALNSSDSSESTDGE